MLRRERMFAVHKSAEEEANVTASVCVCADNCLHVDNDWGCRYIHVCSNPYVFVYALHIQYVLC